MPRATTIAPARRGAVQTAQLVALRDLSGGVDLRRAPTLLEPTRARVLRNWSLQEPGALTTYPGYTTFAGSQGVVQGGQRVYLQGVAPFTLVVASGVLYALSDTGTWTVRTLSTPLSAATQVQVAHDRSVVAVFDGMGAPQKSVDGLTWTTLGIAAPTVPPALSVAVGGALVAGHTYAVAYSARDDGLMYESNIGDDSVLEITSPNQTLVVTLTGAPDTQVETLCVYARDVTAGESVLRRVGTVFNPGLSPYGTPYTTTYTITDNTWSAGLEAPTDHDPAPVLTMAVAWKNRWWGRSATVGNRIHFTQVFETQAWPALFYLDIPFTRGDSIAAMIPLGDTLVVFGQTGVFLIIGQTSLDFEVRPSTGALAGAFGPRAVCAIEQGIVHASAGGVYIFDGASDRYLTDEIDPAWQDLVEGAAVTDLAALAVCYHELRKEIHVAVPRLFPLGTAGEWILDLHRTRVQTTPAWTSTTRPVGGYLAWDGPEVVAGARGRLFAWVRSTGVITEEVTGTTADGAAILAEYEGPTLTTGLPVARFVDVAGEYTPAAGTFGMEVVVDEVSVATQTWVPGSGNAVYGEAAYATDTYGAAGRLSFTTMLPLAAEGRTVLVRAQYRGTQRFTLHSYALGVVPEAVPRGF